MLRREIEDLVLSLVVPGFDGTDVPAWMAPLLERGLAGVCWFGQNIDSAGTRPLADALHDFRDDVLIMSDEEGGGVTRLERTVGSTWPGAAALGAVDDTALTQQVAWGLGQQCREAGVDMPLAPVADVNAQADNPVIGVRSFGASPELVSRHASAFAHGLAEAGVLSCVKHFPGHGSTLVDSHVGLPRIDDPIDVVRQRDLAPFAEVIKAGVPCVMTAHVVVAALDEQPGTMSSTVLGMLRDDLGFEGVICSDALDMDAISQGVGRVEGAIRALGAGVDLLCVGNPGFPRAYDSEQVLSQLVSGVAAAVEEGRLDRDRLERSRDRVRTMVGWAAGHRADPTQDLSLVRGMAADVARRALEVHGDVVVGDRLRLLRVDGAINVAAGRAPSWIADAFVRQLPDVVVSEPSSAEQARQEARHGEVPVILLGARPDETADEIVSAVLAERPDAVVVHLGLPDTARSSTSPHRIHAFGSGRATADAVAALVVGRNR